MARKTPVKLVMKYHNQGLYRNMIVRYRKLDVASKVKYSDSDVPIN